MRRGERIPIHDHSGRDSGGLVAQSTIVTLVNSPGSGSGTTGAPPTAADVPLADVAGLYAQDNVEAALAEIGAHPSDATAAHAASAVSVADTGGYFTATDVEGVLAELATGGGTPDLDALGNVDTTGKADGDVVTWDEGTSTWIAAAPAGGSANDVSLVTIGSSGTAQTIDVSEARTYDITLTGNCTVTLTGAVTAESWSVTVILRQDATGGREVTWPGAVAWIDGTAPVLATDPDGLDVIVLVTVDGGTSWYGFPTGTAATNLVAALDDLSDVTITTPAEGHAIRYRSGTWVNEIPAPVGRWELVVTGTAPPVAMTNDNEDDFLYAEV